MRKLASYRKGDRMNAMPKPQRLVNGRFATFYVPRDKMPQIDEKDYPSLVVASAGQCAFDTVDPSSLMAHQRIDHKRALGMDDRVRIKPIIVSSDGYVVDGNHRWWANVYDGAKWINVIRLGLKFSDALQWLERLPFVYEITPATPERN